MIRTIAMASSKQAAAPSRIRRLPSAIYFEADGLARTAVTQCARIQHKSYESVEPAHLAGNNVFVLADPTMFTEHLKKLRAPNVRVIVLADQRLRDARLDGTVYALDSTTIDLCLSLFPWARFKFAKGAVKMHTLLDLRGSIPTFIEVSDDKRSDVSLLDEILPEAGSFYVMDRGYVDFARLHAFHRCGAFFVTRTRADVLLHRRYSRAVDKTTGLRSDHTVILATMASLQNYPDPLRRVRFYDLEQHRWFVFLTNNFDLPALTIAHLYQARWKIELFFKWIKQPLRIKAFYGHSENAVKTQIWIAIAVYVLVAILKKRLALHATLSQILQVLSVTLFEKMPIFRAFDDPDSQEQSTLFSNQLSLLDF